MRVQQYNTYIYMYIYILYQLQKYCTLTRPRPLLLPSRRRSDIANPSTQLVSPTRSTCLCYNEIIEPSGLHRFIYYVCFMSRLLSAISLYTHIVQFLYTLPFCNPRHLFCRRVVVAFFFFFFTFFRR